MLIEYVQRYNEELAKNKKCEALKAAESDPNGCPAPKVPGSPESIKLVLTGKGGMSVPDDKNIKYLGFVSDEDKFSAMKGSMAICLPSKYESFSITLLEGMGCGKPALVNEKSAVLDGHIEKSRGGFSFGNYEEFKESLTKLLDEKTNTELGSKAAEYVRDNYSKEVVINRLIDFIH